MRPFRTLVIFLLFGFILCTPYTYGAASTSRSSESAAGEYPAHYFVFSYQASGTFQPLSYQLVRLSSKLKPLSAVQVEKTLSQPERNSTQLVVLLQSKNGDTVYRDVVSFSPWLRGEFHSSVPGQGIDGHMIRQDNSAFVIRLPIVEASKLILQDSSRITQAEFGMSKLLLQTPHIQTGNIPFSVDRRLVTGSPANRVDLVILGDGYTAGQADKFLADAQKLTQDFFSISPLNKYSNFYNLYMLGTASNQSGSDHPPYSETCDYYDPTCCGDPAMDYDPLKGQMVDTAFDSRYCAYWIHRLLVADEAKVFAAAGAIPDWDQILLIVNDTTYGGSGGPALAVVSMHSEAVQVAQHEYGHSFVNLADEYSAYYPGYPTCSDLPDTYSPCEANVTDISDHEAIKWLPWILEDTPIPTPNDPFYGGLVGLFEGARYLDTGMYRSGYSCIMRALGEPFCQVPSQAFVLKMYQGGWGVPFEGIRLIEPGTTQPVSQTLSLTHPAAQAFSAAILTPVGGPPVEIAWLDNGVPIPGEVTDVFTYTTRANSPGLHEITLRVKDATALVHPLMEDSALTHTYTWTVDVDVDMTLTADPTEIFADGLSTSAITATLKKDDQPQEGIEVTFTTTLGVVSPISVTTDASGIAMTTLTSAKVTGIATLTASAGSLSESIQVEFVALPRYFLPFVRRQ